MLLSSGVYVGSSVESKILAGSKISVDFFLESYRTERAKFKALQLQADIEFAPFSRVTFRTNKKTGKVYCVRVGKL
jgi:hypothetical protein